MPLILIGHNASVAWSHTVSTAFRFTPFQLALVPGHPTEYLVNGKPVAMTPRQVTIMAKQPDGSLAPVHHTFWWTRYGPMFTDLEGISLPWGTSQGFAFADANAANLARAVNTWFGIDRASPWNPDGQGPRFFATRPLAVYLTGIAGARQARRQGG